MSKKNIITQQVGTSSDLQINQIDDKLLQKLKLKFNNKEQQLFVDQFSLYLNYNQATEFVIDLDNVWQWVGYSTKQKAKDLLVKSFEQNVDFVINKATQPASQVGGSGLLKEEILMTVFTFKEFSMLAGTKRSRQIYRYYINMEQALNEYIQEQAHFLQQRELQLKQENKNLIEQNDNQKKQIQQLKYTFKSKEYTNYISVFKQKNEKKNIYYIAEECNQNNNFEEVYNKKCIDGQQCLQIIKYILDQQDYFYENGNFIICKLDHIKLMIDYVCNQFNVLSQCKQDIQEQELINRLQDEFQNLIITGQQNNKGKLSFDQWAQNNIQYSEDDFVLADDLLQKYNNDTNNQLRTADFSKLLKKYLQTQPQLSTGVIYGKIDKVKNKKRHQGMAFYNLQFAD